MCGSSPGMKIKLAVEGRLGNRTCPQWHTASYRINSRVCHPWFHRILLDSVLHALSFTFSKMPRDLFPIEAEDSNEYETETESISSVICNASESGSCSHECHRTRSLSIDRPLLEVTQHVATPSVSCRRYL